MYLSNTLYIFIYICTDQLYYIHLYMYTGVPRGSSLAARNRATLVCLHENVGRRTWGGEEWGRGREGKIGAQGCVGGVWVCGCVYVCVYVCMYICACMYAYTYTYRLRVRFRQSLLHACMHARVYACMHTYVRIYIHIG